MLKYNRSKRLKLGLKSVDHRNQMELLATANLIKSVNDVVSRVRIPIHANLTPPVRQQQILCII